MNRFRTSLMALCCAAGVAALAAQKDDKGDVAKELKKFQGTWTVESVEAEGKEVPIDLFKDMTVTFEEDKYTVKVGDMVVQKASQKLDPSKSPKTLDATLTDGPGQGTVILGIYEINGDKLKVCFDPEGKKRPTEFKTAAGSQVTLAVYKRAKK